MTPEDFLRTVWPEEGPYCLHVFHPKADGSRFKMNKGFETIEQVLHYTDQNKNVEDVFFAIHTLKTRIEPNPDKPGKYKTFRTHGNMKESRAFFFDLDVGDPAEKDKGYRYETREKAWAALERFLFRTGLPEPFVNSSGGGLHVYWVLTKPIESIEWRTPADKLHWLARQNGLHPDPHRTTDHSSVLRVPGTYNHKGNAKRPVVMLQEGQVTKTTRFLKQLDVLCGEQYAPQQYIAHSPSAGEAGNLAGRVWDGKVISADKVAEVCEHVRNFRDSGGNVAEPVWYASIGAIAHCLDGREKIHDWSSGHQDYDIGETDTKIDQWLSRGIFATTCAKMDQTCGGDACARCPMSAEGRSPVAVATRAQDQELLPPPEVKPEAETDVPVSHVVLVEPPHPYSRRNGGILRERSAAELSDEDGQKYEKILDHDMFPIADFEAGNLDEAYSLWVAQLPSRGQMVFRFTSSTLYSQTFGAELAKNKIWVDPNNLVKVRKYMIAYLKTLQRHALEHKQYDHFGWTIPTKDELVHKDKFVLFEKQIDADTGDIEPCAMSKTTSHAATFMRRGGTRNKQRALLDFYNHPGYLPHQFGILLGYAAPFMRYSGQNGLVVNYSGDPGGGKSTLAYTVAGLYGHPKTYVINGTRNGATMNAREDRMMMLANLPIIVDEITHMTDDEARNMVFAATQPGGKETMNQDRTIRKHRGGIKATLMLTTANSSLHQLINTNNTAGHAGSVRVFEIEIDKAAIPHTKIEADAFIRDMEANFGWLGEEMLVQLLPMREKLTDLFFKEMERIDRDLKLDSEKRFWSVAAAMALTIGKATKRLDLHSFSIPDLRQWLYTVQFPRMMTGLKAETDRRNPVTVLTDYLESIHGNTARVETGNNGNLGTVQVPNAALMAHYHFNDKEHEMWVRLDPFRKHCEKEGHNYNKLVEGLVAAGIITKTNARKTLGEGTNYAKMRSRCFVVDLDHAAIQAQRPASIAPATTSNVVPLRPKKAT